MLESSLKMACLNSIADETFLLQARFPSLELLDFLSSPLRQPGVIAHLQAADVLFAIEVTPREAVAAHVVIRVEAAGVMLLHLLAAGIRLWSHRARHSRKFALGACEAVIVVLGYGGRPDKETNDDDQRPLEYRLLPGRGRHVDRWMHSFLA